MNDEVLAAVAARSATLATQEWAAVEARLHPAFVYTNSHGLRLSRSAYVDFLRDGPLTWSRQWLESPSVVVAGDAAVVTGVVVDDVVVDGEPHLLRFATTQTYVHVDGAWLYLAGQTGPLAED